MNVKKLIFAEVSFIRPDKKFLNKATDTRDIELNQQLQRLKVFNKNLSMDNDDDGDNDGGLQPPLSIPPASTSTTFTTSSASFWFFIVA